MRTLTLSVLPGRYGIYRFAESATIPSPTAEGLWAFVRSEGEVSIICREGGCPHANRKEEDWRVFRMHGPFDFSLTGIIAEVSGALARAGVGIFAISTFDTDYILVKSANLARATDALTKAGHVIS